MIVLWIVSAVWISSVSAAPLVTCPTTWTADALILEADTAEAAFRDQDADTFAEARQRLQDKAGCTSEVVSPNVAARLHRVEALQAFLLAAPPARMAALGGMLSADPGHQIPELLLPLGHPMRAELDAAAARARATPTVTLPTLPGGGWVVDGVAASAVHADTDAFLQLTDAQGRVLESRYHTPDGPLDGWVLSPAGELGARARSPLSVSLGPAGLWLGAPLSSADGVQLNPMISGGAALNLQMSYWLTKRWGVQAQAGYQGAWAGAVEETALTSGSGQLQLGHAAVGVAWRGAAGGGGRWAASVSPALLAGVGSGEGQEGESAPFMVRGSVVAGGIEASASRALVSTRDWKPGLTATLGAGSDGAHPMAWGGLAVTLTAPTAQPPRAGSP